MPTIAQVVGINLRRVRTDNGWTQDVVAAACRESGLRASGSRVAQIESGDIAPTIANLVRLTSALNSLASGCVSVHDFLQSEVPLQISADPTETVTSDELTAFLSGAPADLIHERLRAAPAFVGAMRSTAPRSGVTNFGRCDERVARQLGLNKQQMLDMTQKMWGRGLEDERNKRAAESADTRSRLAARGSVTALLREELRAEITRQREAPPAPITNNA